MKGLRSGQPLSVCFFSNSAQLEGGERSSLELVTELIEDYDVACSVVLPFDGPLRQKLEEVGASVLIADYSMWCDHASLSEEDMRSRLNSGFRNVFNMVNKRIIKLNPDVILTNTNTLPWGAVAAQLLDKPHVWFVREFGILDHGFRFFLPFDEILEFVRTSSNIVLTNSDATRKALFGNIRKGNILTLYSHIDIPPDAFSQDENRYFQRAESIKLVITGNIVESKGQLDALLAVRELIRRKRDVELIVMGRSFPDYIERLRRIVDKENLQSYVKFLDFKENPYPVVGQADIVLMCSRNEAFGRVTLEAMLLKKPVIGTNTGGTPELIRKGFNGLLYRPGDYTELADRIEYFITHRGKIKEFGENGYKFATKLFTRKRYGGRVYQLLKGLKKKANPISSPHSRFVTGLLSDALSDLEEMKIRTDQLSSTLQAKDSEITNITTTLKEKTAQIDQLSSTLQAKDSEITNITTTLKERNAEKKSLAEELSETKDELVDAKRELIAIQESIGYSVACYFGSLIFRMLPDGTRRGVFRKIVVKSLQIAMKEGVRNLCKYSWEKIKRREFHIVER